MTEQDISRYQDQVYFDTNKVIRESLAEAGFPAPMPAQSVIVTQSA